MSILHLTITVLYFSVGSFIAGTYYDELRNIPKLRLFFGMLILVLFGTLLHILGIIWFKLIVAPINYFDTVFQIKSGYMLYFTKQFNNMTENQLRLSNRIAINKHSSNSLRDRIWRRMIIDINKRNNYDPKLDEHFTH